MEEMTTTGSQTVTSQTEEMQETQAEEQDTSLTDAFEAFGIPPKTEKETVETEDDSAPPAKEEAKAEGEAKGIKVKYNKEERFVDESEIPDLVEKGLNLDKIRTQKTEIEKELDEAAMLLGFKDRADFVANREKLKEQQQQQQQNQLRQQEDEFDQLKQRVIDELVYNGVDEQAAREYAEKNPYVQKAKEAVEQKRKTDDETAKAAKWQPLYQARPELAEAYNKGDLTWVTPELIKLVDEGNAPLVAYEFLNREKMQEQTKKAAEQKVIKDQMLGKRSQVETVTPADNEPSIPDDVADQFKAFGLPPSAAKKYLTK